MDEKGLDKVIAFDTLFTSNSIQMLKILLTYMEPSSQKGIAIYIKFMELQYTLDFFNKHPNAALDMLPHEENLEAAKLCDEIFPLCSTAEQEKLSQMKQMYQQFHNMQEMMEMINMMKELFPQGMGGDEGGSNDFLSGLAGMSGMDLSQMSQMSEMFSMFQNNQT